MELGDNPWYRRCYAKLGPNLTHRIISSHMQAIYYWDGRYFGFIDSCYFFDAESNYRGWIDSDGTVWRSDGQFLGDLVGGEYVLLQQSTVRASQPRRLAPSRPVPPARSENRPARSARPGYIDGLINLK
jgi:4-fold beta flower protein